MGQHGRRQGKKHPPNAKAKNLPPSGNIVPEMGGGSTRAPSIAARLEIAPTELKLIPTDSPDQPADSRKSVGNKARSKALDGVESSGSLAFSSPTHPVVESIPGLPSERKAGALQTEQTKGGSLKELVVGGLGFRSVSWSQVTGSYRRERSIEGLLVGASVGDALGLCRKGLSRRSAASMFGRTAMTYKLIPGLGLVSDDTHRMLMTLQAMLRSKSQLENFKNSFATRLRWYLFTVPITTGTATQLAAVRLWMGVAPELSGVSSSGNSPLISALALATVLQGTGHSVERWVTASTRLTHKSPEVTEAAILVAHAAHMALMVPKREFDSCRVMDDLIALTQETSLKKMLQSLHEPLSQGFSVHRAAKAIGFRKGIPALASASAVMAVYAWLRHPNSFRRAVTSAIRAGGDTDAVAALVGGLSGVRLGVDAIPKSWSNRVSTWPQNRRWIDKLTGRLTDWPHGSEDLHKAPALATYPLRQILRSAGLALGVAIGTLVRTPWRIATWLDRKSS